MPTEETRHAAHSDVPKVAIPGTEEKVCGLCFGIGIRYALLFQLHKNKHGRGPELPDIKTFVHTSFVDQHAFEEGAKYLDGVLGKDAHEELVAKCTEPQLGGSLQPYDKKGEFYVAKAVSKDTKEIAKTKDGKFPLRVDFHICSKMNGEAYHGLFAAVRILHIFFIYCTERL